MLVSLLIDLLLSLQVFWIATLYANIWGAALAVLALGSASAWIGLGVLAFQV